MKPRFTVHFLNLTKEFVPKLNQSEIELVGREETNKSWAVFTEATRVRFAS